MKRNSLQGWLAVVLLLFASADLSADLVAPQACCEWLDNLVSAPASQRLSAAQASVDPAAIVAAAEALPQESSPGTDVEEDCFCCCAHILPGTHFDVSLLHTTPPASFLTNALLPFPPSQSQFRPPRLA